MAGETWLGKATKFLVDSYLYGTQSLKATRNRSKFVNTFLDRLGKTNLGYINTGEVSEMLKLALVSSWVYADVTLLSNRFSSVDLFTLEKPTKEKDRRGKPKHEVLEEHPIYDLWETPNSLMSGNFLKRYVAMWYCTMGNAFIYMVPEFEGKGPIVELWPLPTLSVRPLVETQRISNKTKKPIIDYVYNAQGEEIILPGENMIHFRTANALDYWVGMSQLTALQMPIRTDYSQAYWLDSFFGQDNAIPAAMISVPADLDEADFETVRRDIQEQFSGGRRTGITRAGQISVEVIQHAISEMRVLEGRAFNQGEIDRIYHIPEGIFSAASGDSQLAAEISLGRNAVQPMVNIFVEEVRAKFVPWYNESDPDIYMVPENVVPNDQRLDMEEYRVYGPDRTINENREIQDEPPLKLPKEFESLQVLLDDIPQSLYKDVAPVVIAKWQKEFDPPEEKSPFSFGDDFGFGRGSEFDDEDDLDEDAEVSETDDTAEVSETVDKEEELGTSIVDQKSFTPDQIASIKMALYRQTGYSNGHGD